MTEPLRVALVVKNTPSAFERDRRNMGLFSYPVKEFVWEHFTFGKGFAFDTTPWEGRFDLVFHEDGGNWGTFTGKLPVVYYAIDSTLSDAHHFKPRLEQGRKSTLVLLDHDRVERFADTGRPVKMLPYCVNDRVFFRVPLLIDNLRELDFTFHCAGDDAGKRREVRQVLHDIAVRHGYQYRSGVLALSQYAEAMQHSKIVVNWPRVWGNRPHRMFDALACGACLVTGPVPHLTCSDYLESGIDYVEVATPGELEQRIQFMLAQTFDVAAWQSMAQRGHKRVMELHTWAVRAAQLRELLKQELGL